jgi:hypothetical protein
MRKREKMKSFVVLMLLSVGLLVIALIAMGVKILFVKNGKFPSSSVGKNPALAKQGIRCAKHEEIARFRKMQKLKLHKINPKKLSVVRD